MDTDEEIIAIRYFYFETKARLYAARLESEGIPSFVSNSHSGTVMPLGNPSIGLHIRKIDYEIAQRILEEMEEYEKQIGSYGEESFRDADHEEIAYQRQLHQKRKGQNKQLMILVGIIILLVLLRTIWRMWNPEKAFDIF